MNKEDKKALRKSTIWKWHRIYFIFFLLNSFKLHIYSLAMDHDSRHQAEQKKMNEMEINSKYSNRFSVDFNPFLVSFFLCVCLLSQSVADRLDISQSILCCTNSSFELWQQLENNTENKKELLNDLKCGGEHIKRWNWRAQTGQKH